MSPEQTDGSGTDDRTEIWSLGVVLYEMVTGQQPFKGDYDKAVMYSILNEEPEPITAVRAGVPMELEVFASKAMAKASSERYQSASDLAIDLAALGKKIDSSGSRVLQVPMVQPASAAPVDRELLWKRICLAGASVGALGWGLYLFHQQDSLGTTAPKTVRSYRFTKANLPFSSESYLDPGTRRRSAARARGDGRRG